MLCTHTGKNVPDRRWEEGGEPHRTQWSMEEEQGNGTWASVLREAGSQVFGKFGAENDAPWLRF